MIRQVLGLVRVACLFIWPPDIYVRARVDEARDADFLAEREEHVDVMEPWRFGPVAGVAAGTGPGQVSGVPLASPCPGQPEPTSELLFAAANQLEQVRCHLHFDHPREEYLARLVPELRARGISFARQYD
jgi:hypothetical protein